MPFVLLALIWALNSAIWLMLGRELVTGNALTLAQLGLIALGVGAVLCLFIDVNKPFRRRSQINPEKLRLPLNSLSSGKFIR